MCDWLADFPTQLLIDDPQAEGQSQTELMFVHEAGSKPSGRPVLTRGHVLQATSPQTPQVYKDSPISAQLSNNFLLKQCTSQSPNNGFFDQKKALDYWQITRQLVYRSRNRGTTA